MFAGYFGRAERAEPAAAGLAQRYVDALPPEVAEEVVLTGSVSRGVADEASDVEMLVVTPEQMELAACFELARAAGLEELDTWGDQIDADEARLRLVRGCLLRARLVARSR